MNHKPLTAKQRAVLDFIRASRNANGFPPTVREICIQFGWASANAADCHINALIDKGCITKEEGKVRTIKITTKGEQS